MISQEEGQPYSRRQEGIPRALVMKVDVAQTQSGGHGVQRYKNG